AKVGGELVGEAISRLRRGEVIRQSGYDGEYGVIRLFEPNELDSIALFDMPGISSAKPTSPTATVKPATLAALPNDSFVEVVVENGRTEPSEATTSTKLPSPTSSGSGLDPEQLAAVESEAKQLIIVAGPGTGKTRTLTHRIAHLIQRHEVPPGKVAAVTFTRRAADEMAERLGLLLGEAAGKITVSTFHALSLRIIREQHEALGLAADVNVADETQRLVALIAVVGDEKAARGALKKQLGDEVREAFSGELHRRGLLDVDELVGLTADLLETRPEVLARYHRQFRWLFVDEYQDIDPTQYRLLRALAPANAGLCVIGDPDQSIYRFRGAEVGFFMRFTADYPNAQSYTLSRNYRSTASVVSLAAAVVRPASLVPDREFVATQGAGARPSLHRAEHATDEAAEVARVIDELVGGSSFHSIDTGRVETTTRGHRIGFGDIAVLYRTDTQSTPLIAALDRAGVPYQKRGHDPLAKRAGVPELIHELRYADSAVTNG
ncbi:MAG: UvrD-helicase domain-containing protein, partial [Mycobacteriales bacterium]